MVFWLCCLTGILITIVILLTLKIHLLKKSADEISDAFSDRLTSDSNEIGRASCRERV